jgi:ABC-type multidrug transport system fused ATPase/permease subunit
MGFVQQEPSLFGLSVRDNITYGLTTPASDAAIEAACRSANAHDFISGFPEGYATKVGERGVRLSGGQKQRLAIARALLIDPCILLLDEATSALDSESEWEVQQAIATLMVGRTTVVVAHRLSTIRNCDQIVVVDGGRIVDTGTHDVLMARCTRYQDLVRRQTERIPEI